MSNFLVKILGFPATLIHGDTLVLDRWRWLKKRLSRPTKKARLIDVGCGSGAFTIGAARRGYTAVGLSWDKRNQAIAAQRAQLCKAPTASFEIQDVRQLHQRTDWHGQFDVAICLEVIEHILNDQKVFQDINALLKPGGKLLLTTPYYHYKAIVPSDNGPFCTEETGWHVRRGYVADDLKKLCKNAGFEIEEISYCSGFLSQKITGVLWRTPQKMQLLGWLLILPLRIFPPLLDGLIRKTTRWPDYSIGLLARKVAEHEVDN